MLKANLCSGLIMLADCMLGMAGTQEMRMIDFAVSKEASSSSRSITTTLSRDLTSSIFQIALHVISCDLLQR